MYLIQIVYVTKTMPVNNIDGQCNVCYCVPKVVAITYNLSNQFCALIVLPNPSVTIATSICVTIATSISVTIVTIATFKLL